ncbi:hypothetical protein [Microbacterium sp.]|uniref:hypothetical protein n=1 Tax=Microbacterium sp. TaxID=51671 RepID=UPI003A84C0E4
MADKHTHGADRTLVWTLRAVGYFVYWYLIVVETVLALAFVLRALGADPSVSFAARVYRSADRAMAPFTGLFPSIGLASDGSATLDTSILFAMVCYGIVLVGVGLGLDWLGRKLRGIDVRERMQAQQDAYDAAVSASETPPDIVGDLAAGTTPAASAPVTRGAQR